VPRVLVGVAEDGLDAGFLGLAATMSMGTASTGMPMKTTRPPGHSGLNIPAIEAAFPLASNAMLTPTRQWHRRPRSADPAWRN